jgi:hypothetical protein
MKRKKAATAITVFLWMAAVGTGMAWFVDYKSRPGRIAVAPSGDDSLVPRSELPRLLVLIHPRCVCSRATLAEIERLMSRNPGAIDVHALFYKPEGVPEDWEKTDTWEKASAMPGMHLSTIDDQALVKFGAVTSGQVFLYDVQDHLIFSGGVTVGRAHEGDNTGRSSIETYLRTGRATTATAPVFGCILYAPNES